MAILEIIKHPNAVLETPCDRVLDFDKKLVKLLQDMYDTMVAADGVGLAAPQVGISKQIAIVEAGDNGRIDLINPVILEARGEQIGPEGCLSFPDLYGDVPRAEYVKVRAQNKRGKIFVLEARGFLARAIQHEIDHLNGVLFTSKVTKYYDPEELE
ncbi:peptide deformylase [Ectobacillus antri]|uniref:Peptide deformylase n=1 Tax=Ectobacillus antri TaxID=2486280 RepID=A0ABT6H1D6_9BACI|nr:peptide deformylase [Ectobacillus antri]MDG4655883.1 peptide deformylase [Ectobacillus antri]MDG5752558.1 peptide deformylase [Ectobacillus antri]